MDAEEQAVELIFDILRSHGELQVRTALEQRIEGHLQFGARQRAPDALMDRGPK
jgi:hypothetical protein